MDIFPYGQFTSTIYGAIRDEKYAEVIDVLQVELQNFSANRGILSLLGYCYYKSCDFFNAVEAYEQLVAICPEVEEYKVYYAQSLFKAGMYQESLRAAIRVESEQFQQRMLLLQSMIKYELDELAVSKSLLDQCHSDDPDVVINYAAISFKEGKFEIARKAYSEALATLGFQANISYNIALCYYREKQYGQALHYIADIIDRGIRHHPELSVGSNSEGTEARSVGNSTVLKETALIEAFNLKAAIEYQLQGVDGNSNLHGSNNNSMDAAKEALTDMPPRSEDELDPVTLHNQALIHAEEDPMGSIKKLTYLITHPPYPPETFGNLLLLHCKFQNFDVAAGLLAENAQLTYKYLSQELYDYLEASLMVPVSPEEAYRKFDDLANRHVDHLRKLTKLIQDARLARDTDLTKTNLKLYDDELELYIPVLMAQARIYWDKGQYTRVEKILMQSSEFCSDVDAWQVNIGHSLFMQESKYKEAIQYYEPLVKKNESDSLLSVTAVVLANLCVSHILHSQNDEAEEVMKSVEREEEQLAITEPNKQTLHLCIINLVIGTLYCCKGNFEFGISRVIKVSMCVYVCMCVDS